MSKVLISCGWDDVPHLGEQEKKELWDATPEYLRDARKFGKPAMGAGAIYPISETSVFVEPFEINPGWKRGS